jgi:hypothetical protein
VEARFGTSHRLVNKEDLHRRADLARLPVASSLHIGGDLSQVGVLAAARRKLTGPCRP